MMWFKFIGYHSHDITMQSEHLAKSTQSQQKVPWEVLKSFSCSHRNAPEIVKIIKILCEHLAGIMCKPLLNIRQNKHRCVPTDIAARKMYIGIYCGDLVEGYM